METLKESKMKTVYHPAGSRGHANHGWLDTYHSFSFANYQNRERMNFGVLRVLNDDTVQGGMGFGSHPHRDMEIVSIPLEGALEHKDSTGTIGVIQKGAIQVMTAGSGVMHSEYNHNKHQEMKFLQIWVFPRQTGLTPRGEQMRIADNAKKNDFQQIVSPDKNEEGLWINQDAWFSLADFDKGNSKEYTIKKEGNGVYVFVIKGWAQIGEQLLGQRDGLGIWNTKSFIVEAAEDAEILLIDIPMQLPEYLFS